MSVFIHDDYPEHTEDWDMANGPGNVDVTPCYLGWTILKYVHFLQRFFPLFESSGRHQEERRHFRALPTPQARQGQQDGQRWMLLLLLLVLPFSNGTVHVESLPKRQWVKGFPTLLEIRKPESTLSSLPFQLHYLQLFKVLHIQENNWQLPSHQVSSLLPTQYCAAEGDSSQVLGFIIHYRREKGLSW